MGRVNERAVIVAVPFWMDLCASIYYLAAPLVVIEMGGTPVELGLIGTITSSVHMFLSNVMGRFSDRFGRRLLIVAGPLLFSASCLMMSRAGEVRTILLLAALNGLSFAFFWPALQAWVAEVRNGSGLARNIGTFNLSWTASHFAGPTLSGLLFAFQPRLPFLVAAGLALGLFLFLWSSVGERERQPEKIRREAPPPPGRDPRKFLYAIWVANFVSWFILGNVRYQFPKLAREIEISPQSIGVLISLVGTAQFFGFLFLRQTRGWHFSRVFLFALQAVAAAALLLIYSSESKVAFGSALVMIGLCVSLTYYSSLYYAVFLLPQKGKGTGLHESILGSGVVLGPLLGGAVAQFAGLRSPYLLCLAVLLAAAGWEFFFLRKNLIRTRMNTDSHG